MNRRLKSRTKWIRQRYFGSAWYVKFNSGISAGELDIRHSGSIVSIRLVRDTFQEDEHERLCGIATVSRHPTADSAEGPVVEHFRVGYD